MLQVLLATAAFTTSLGTSSKLAMSQLRGGALSMSTAVAIVVDVEVKPDRLDEFMGVIEADAVGSQQEAGCVRFDVLRDQSNPNRFFFYEVYVDADAIAVHKAQPHFKLWTDFKESGGVVSSVSTKCDFPGDWALTS